MVGGVPSRPLILIAAPDGLHPALARLTSGPQYRTMVVHTGENVLRALYEYRPDGLILSLRLPGLDPWEVLSRVRDMSDLPIAVVDLTYRVADAARALEAGADDYLTAELPDRLHLPLLRARLRRATDAPPGTAPVVEDGLLTLDLGTHEAVLSGHRLDLTPIEFDVLLTLARHPGQVLSADRLLRTVWDVPAGSDASRVKYTVLRLRRKIARTTGAPAPIETVRGVGYRYPPAAGPQRPGQD
ncbi:two-component system, OmpR family, response regulator MtrA/two-component system, OmpR family, response regulator PrrA [Streptomyces sp. DvalAA-43]|nr:response regulator transcription factor [Streptomyces sp. SID4936]SCE03010.1 two-component system, OmpR family, response regulator MtrA/two-component system, OmpR family, response regulator PrrA [Streptomyces sp. DvalAA-43]